MRLCEYDADDLSVLLPSKPTPTAAPVPAPTWWQRWRRWLDTAARRRYDRFMPSKRERRHVQ